MFAVEKNMKVPQVWSTKQIVTYDWLRGFMSRNDYLSLRTPEPTSLGRSTAFNKHTADDFFSLLRQVLEREKFTPASTYNCDETGVQTAHKPRKIISKKRLQASKQSNVRRTWIYRDSLLRY